MIASSKTKGFSATPAALVVLGLALTTACSTTGGERAQGTADRCPGASDPALCRSGSGANRLPLVQETGPQKAAQGAEAGSANPVTGDGRGPHAATTSPFDPTDEGECTLQPSPTFPGKFQAVQVVEFSRGPEAARQRNWMLATLKRRPSSLHLSMADAVLQTPLADVEIQNGKIVSETYFGSAEDQREPISELALSLDRFYGTSALKCHGRSVRFRDRVMELVARSWDQFPGCPFPQKISVKVSGEGTLRVEVRTEEVTCSDAR